MIPVVPWSRRRLVRVSHRTVTVSVVKTPKDKDDTFRLPSEEHDNHDHTHLCRDLDVSTGHTIALGWKAVRYDDTHLCRRDSACSTNSNSVVSAADDHVPSMAHSPGIVVLVGQSRMVGDGMSLPRTRGSGKDQRGEEVPPCRDGMGLTAEGETLKRRKILVEGHSDLLAGRGTRTSLVRGCGNNYKQNIRKRQFFFIWQC